MEPVVTAEPRPPQVVLAACEKPKMRDVDSNRELLALLIETKDALDRCAAKVEAIRRFYGGE